MKFNSFIILFCIAILFSNCTTNGNAQVNSSGVDTIKIKENQVFSVEEIDDYVSEILSNGENFTFEHKTLNQEQIILCYINQELVKISYIKEKNSITKTDFYLKNQKLIFMEDDIAYGIADSLENIEQNTLYYQNNQAYKGFKNGEEVNQDSLSLIDKSSIIKEYL